MEKERKGSRETEHKKDREKGRKKYEEVYEGKGKWRINEIEMK